MRSEREQQSHTAAHAPKSAPARAAAAQPAASVLALQSSVGNNAVARALRAPASPARLQRRVTAFKSEGTPLPTPLQQVAGRPGLFEKSPIRKSIEEKLNRERIGARLTFGTQTRPSAVTATLTNMYGPRPARKPGPSAIVGWIGTHDFYIRSGNPDRSFEGGHLVTHALFSKGDPKVDSADDFGNLVPMSRNVNIGTWARKEAWVANQVADLTDHEKLDIRIPLTYKDATVPVSAVASRLGLEPASGKEDADMTIQSWVPDQIGPVTGARKPKRGKGEPTSTISSPAFETPGKRRAGSRLGSAREVLETLESFGLSITPGLRKQIAALDSSNTPAPYKLATSLQTPPGTGYPQTPIG